MKRSSSITSQPQCPQLYSGDSDQNQGWLLDFLGKHSELAFPVEVRSHFTLALRATWSLPKRLNSTIDAEKQSQITRKPTSVTVSNASPAKQVVGCGMAGPAFQGIYVVPVMC